MLQQPEVRPANVAMNLWYHKMGRDQEEGHKTLAYNICQRSARHGGDMERSRVTSDHQRWRNLVARCSETNGRTCV